MADTTRTVLCGAIHGLLDQSQNDHSWTHEFILASKQQCCTPNASKLDHSRTAANMSLLLAQIRYRFDNWLRKSQGVQMEEVYQWSYQILPCTREVCSPPAPGPAFEGPRVVWWKSIIKTDAFWKFNVFWDKENHATFILLHFSVQNHLRSNTLLQAHAKKDNLFKGKKTNWLTSWEMVCLVACINCLLCLERVVGPLRFLIP